MRTVPIAPNEYYHLCGKRINGDALFLDQADYARFLFLILYLQSPTQLHNISQFINHFLKTGSFKVSQDTTDNIIKNRSVKLLAYCLMGNHFHLLIENIDDGAISVYMHRVLMGYSKYFNAKYKKIGHVFQGPYTAVHIENNTQLLHTSSYIHKNPRDIAEWQDSYYDYPYSSLGDYIKESRWNTLLEKDIILDQFKTPDEYQKFIETSTAKEQDLFKKIF